MMRRSFYIALAALSLSACGGSGGDIADAGATLAQDKGCIACHGLDGRATAPIYPHLNIQWERYLRLQLIAYRDGVRENSIMQGFAAELSDEEINVLAEFYGR